jgi:predicted nucleic acid-binding protein
MSAAGNAYFVDSNLLLYSVDVSDSRKNSRAGEWLRILWVEGAGRLSWQVVHEFYYNAVRKMRVDAGYVREVAEDITQWTPVPTTLGLVQRAWHWIDSAQLSYWDALILAAAERTESRYLLSENFQDGRRYGDVEIVNPFDHSPSEFTF